MASGDISKPLMQKKHYPWLWFDADGTLFDYSDVLIIGDSLTSDIQGGVDYGIDTCWYNPTSEPRSQDLPIIYEIGHLRELLEVLDY